MKMFLTVFMAVCMACAVYAQEPAAVPESVPVAAEEPAAVADAPAAEISAPAEAAVETESAEPAPCHAAVKGIALITAGNVEADLVARVQKYVQSELFTTVTILDPMELAEGELDGQAQAAVAKKTDDHLAVLVLVSLEGNTHHGASYPDQSVAVINVAALRPDPMDAELYGRRIEKQLMSAGGILLGMDICPNPLCALSAYENMERLDAKGRNYCPPCQDRVKKILQEKGALLEPVTVQ
ncbi:MAG: hypothetical protein AB7T27_03955 [Kiritimatiellia bacterium]